MKHSLLIAFVVSLFAAAVSSVATPDEPVGQCPVSPPVKTHDEFDPKPARYVLPESNEPEPGYVLDEKGATITYTDLGTVEGHLCPGSDVNWWFTETMPVKHAYPDCWVVEPVKTSSCPGEKP